MNLPKFTQITNTTHKSLVHINDMFKFKSSLSNIKQQAEVSGFSLIVKARTFKAAYAALVIEVKNNGLIVI